jgi:hypothetical protein
MIADPRDLHRRPIVDLPLDLQELGHPTKTDAKFRFDMFLLPHFRLISCIPDVSDSHQ